VAYAGFDDPEGLERMRQWMGPGHVDQQIRQAIQFAWMMLPAEKKTVDEVERLIRQMVDRALKEFRDDSESFGKRS
jgi:hypothetical protein